MRLSTIDQMELDKTKIIFGGALGGVLTYLGLSHTAIAMFAILLVIDYMTGVVASWLDDPKKVKSSVGIRGIIKKVSMFLVPFVVAIMFKGINMDHLEGLTTGFVGAYVSIIIITETYSIIGNITSIVSGKRVPENEALTQVLNALSSSLINYIQEILKKGQDKKS